MNKLLKIMSQTKYCIMIKCVHENVLPRAQPFQSKILHRKAKHPKRRKVLENMPYPDKDKWHTVQQCVKKHHPETANLRKMSKILEENKFN